MAETKVEKLSRTGASSLLVTNNDDNLKNYNHGIIEALACHISDTLR